MTSTHQSVDFEFTYRGKSIAMRLPSGEDHISKTIMHSGAFYELELLESLALDLHPGDVVVDVGANIGNHSVYFASVLGCRVEAFEAVESTAQILEQNVRRNDLGELVAVHKIALGESHQLADIAKYDQKNIGATSLKFSSEGSVRVVPLDAIEIRRPVRLLKVDVEGMDLDVLKGAKAMIARDRPWIVCEAAGEAQFRAVSEFLGELNFQPAGVYNATDTYLFLPASTTAEWLALVMRNSELIMQLQRDLRAARDKIAQTGRYSEQLQREAIAALEEQIAGAESKVSGADERISGLTSTVADMREEAVEREAVGHLRGEAERLRNKVSALETAATTTRDAYHRVMDIKNSTIEEARSVLERERADRMEECDALRRGVEAANREIERLLGRFSVLRDASDARAQEHMRRCRELESQLNSRERSLAELGSEHRAVQERIAQQELTWKQEREKLRIDILGLHGRLARAAERERNLTYKAARLRDTAAASRDGLAATEAELARLRSSLAFKVGTHLATSLRSVIGTLKLPYTLPLLVWRDMRGRTRVSKKNGSTAR